MNTVMTGAVHPRLVLSIALGLSVGAANANEKPPDSVFEQSPFEFTIKTPPAFKTTRSTSGYLPTPVGNVPYRDQSWARHSTAVVVRRIVMPDLWWQTIAPHFFADAKLHLPGAPNVRVISERDYSVSGCPAHSFVISTPGQEPKFWRIDYVLAKPDLYEVMFIAQSEAELSGTTCNKFYESVSIKSKTDH